MWITTKNRRQSYDSNALNWISNLLLHCFDWCAQLQTNQIKCSFIKQVTFIRDDRLVVANNNSMMLFSTLLHIVFCSPAKTYICSSIRVRPAKNEQIDSYTWKKIFQTVSVIEEQCQFADYSVRDSEEKRRTKKCFWLSQLV